MDFKKLSLALAAAALLGGCSTPEDDVRAQLKELTRNLTAQIPPLPAPVAYETFAYEVEAMADPFAPSKIAMKVRPGNGLQPDFQRPKEPLEAFALETIKMVGAVKKDGVMWAVITADGYVYNIKVGQYVGQNFGRVVSIGENDMSLREMFQETNGDWSERDATISIQEPTEAKK